MADKNFLTDIIDADLAEGKISEIHTRFPPEPNGYLHIGSAKAIYINWSIANQYGGKFNLRLDDTNPAREGEEYVNSIIEDLHWLGADPNGGIFYGSDYFDKCYEYAEKLQHRESRPRLSVFLLPYPEARSPGFPVSIIPPSLPAALAPIIRRRRVSFLKKKKDIIIILLSENDTLPSNF